MKYRNLKSYKILSITPMPSGLRRGGLDSSSQPGGGGHLLGGELGDGGVTEGLVGD